MVRRLAMGSDDGGSGSCGCASVKWLTRLVKQYLVLIGVLLASCAAWGRRKSYRLKLGKRIFGESPRRWRKLPNANRWSKDANSPWYWKFRLLQAEALTAEQAEASALLSQPVPSRSGIGPTGSPAINR